MSAEVVRSLIIDGGSGHRAGPRHFPRPRSPGPMSAPVGELIAIASSSVRLLRCLASSAPSASLYAAGVHDSHGVVLPQLLESLEVERSGMTQRRLDTCVAACSVILRGWPGMPGGTAGASGVFAAFTPHKEPNASQHQECLNPSSVKTQCAAGVSARAIRSQWSWVERCNGSRGGTGRSRSSAAVGPRAGIGGSSWARRHVSRP